MRSRSGACSNSLRDGSRQLLHRQTPLRGQRCRDGHESRYCLLSHPDLPTGGDVRVEGGGAAASGHLRQSHNVRCNDERGCSYRRQTEEETSQDI